MAEINEEEIGRQILVALSQIKTTTTRLKFELEIMQKYMVDDILDLMEQAIMKKISEAESLEIAHKAYDTILKLQSAIIEMMMKLKRTVG